MSVTEGLLGTSRTESQDYGESYYRAHLGTDEPYSWDTPHWRTFFTQVAASLSAATNPTTVLDVGCARGLLVQALRERGIEAKGIDVSEHAVTTAHEDVQPYLEVAGADKIAGRYDLITCIEVLEHLSPLDADAAIGAMCAASHRILISSSPADFTEPTHVNVREPEAWAAAFAERGYFRRTDLDFAVLTPWATLFEKADLTPRDLVHRYERYAYPMRVEVLEKRAALLQAHRRISEIEDAPQAEHLQQVDLASALEEQQTSYERALADQREAHDRAVEALRIENATELARLREEGESKALELRREVLSVRDYAIGAAAEAGLWRSRAQEATEQLSDVSIERDQLVGEVAGLSRELGETQARLHALDAHVQEIKHSMTWRIGRAVVNPLSLRRRAGRGEQQ